MKKVKDIYAIGLVLTTVGLCYALVNYWSVGESFVNKLYTASMPFLTGAGIACVVNIVMNSYEALLKRLFHREIPMQRLFSLTLAYLTFIVAIVFLFVIVVPDLIVSLQALLRIDTSDIQKFLDDLQHSEWVERVLEYTGTEKDLSRLIASYNQQISRQVITLLTNLLSSVTSFASGILSVFVSLIFSIYILSSKEKLARQANLLLDTYLGRFAMEFHRIRLTFHQSFKGFFVGQTLEAIILGSLCTLGMLIFKFPYASTIGILIAFTALIPVVGAYIGVTIGTLLIMTQSVEQAMWFVVYVVILQQFEGNLIYPRVVGGSIGLPGIWVLVSIALGAALGGIFGMLIAVPTAASLYKLLKADVLKRQTKKEY